MADAEYIASSGEEDTDEEDVLTFCNGKTAVEVSRSGTSGYRAIRRGRRGGKIPSSRKLMNWFDPWVFQPIYDAGKRLSFMSLTAIVKEVQKSGLRVYDKLSATHVMRWINETKTDWRLSAYDAMKRGNAMSGQGRAGVLQNYPDITDEVKATIKSLRERGLPVISSTVRALLLTSITIKAPQLLESDFKCSEVSLGIHSHHAFIMGFGSLSLSHGWVLS